nr:SpoIIE family protein phosphatase [Streptomyces sp. 8K308]
MPSQTPPRYLPVPESVPPLGLGREPEALRDEVRRTDVPPGAFLLLYTDGGTEARDTHGELYDPAVALAGHTFRDSDDLTDALTADIVAYASGAL